MRIRENNLPIHPDDPDFYVDDHMNVDACVERLGFKQVAANRGFSYKRFMLEIPLAAGYKHPVAKRPANYCQITFATDSSEWEFYCEFSFGWMRRKSAASKDRCILVPIPGAHWGTKFNFSSHLLLMECEQELTEVLELLQTKAFDSLLHVSVFMKQWTANRYAHERCKESLNKANRFIHKNSKPKQQRNFRKKVEPGHRMASHVIRNGSHR